jgi:hypothetical protein
MRRIQNVLAGLKIKVTMWQRMQETLGMEKLLGDKEGREISRASR